MRDSYKRVLSKMLLMVLSFLIVISPLSVYANTSDENISFMDVPDNSLYADCIKALSDAGVIYGYSDGLFKPFQYITLAEAVTISERAFGNGNSIPEDWTQWNNRIDLDVSLCSDYNSNTAKWGCELEGTGCTRATAASVIANYFATSYNHFSDSYDRYTIDSSYGVWTVMRDSSVTPLKKERGSIVSASDLYRVEIVTPPMHGASDIPIFQDIIRLLRKKGFFPCTTAGCHVHIEVKNLKPDVIVNIFNLVFSKQNMLMHSLGLSEDSPRYRYCQIIPCTLVVSFKKLKRKLSEDLTLNDIAKVYYTVMGGSANYFRESTTRYPNSRYYICNATRCLNPNSQWYLGTIEFRLFNSENHAGKIKSYIQFCLLLVQYAASISKSSFKETTVEDFESEKYKFRCFLLKLNCIGNEFKTMRKFFLENFGNQSSAWRRGDHTNHSR